MLICLSEIFLVIAFTTLLLIMPVNVKRPAVNKLGLVLSFQGSESQASLQVPVPLQGQEPAAVKKASNETPAHADLSLLVAAGQVQQSCLCVHCRLTELQQQQSARRLSGQHSSC